MTQFTCQQCWWFEHDGDPETSHYGVCFQRPPVVFINSHDAIVTTRPEVRESDRCAKWHKKEQS